MSKHMGICLMIIVSIIIFSQPDSAAASSVSTEATIIFEGTEDNQTTDDNHLIPNGSEQVEVPDKEITTPNGSKLPKTATHMHLIIIIGLSLLAIGTLFLVYQSRPRRVSE